MEQEISNPTNQLQIQWGKLSTSCSEHNFTHKMVANFKYLILTVKVRRRENSVEWKSRYLWLWIRLRERAVSRRSLFTVSESIYFQVQKIIETKNKYLKKYLIIALREVKKRATYSYLNRIEKDYK